MAQTAWGGCSGASSMCVPRERRKVLGRRQLCQRALLLLGLGGLVGAKAVQRPCSRTRPEPAPEEFPGESRCASALHRDCGALQQHRHIRHRPNFDLRATRNSCTNWSRLTAGKKPIARNGHSYLTPRCPIITR